MIHETSQAHVSHLHKRAAPGSFQAHGSAGGGPLSSIKKTDDELQIVWAEVYVPLIPDSQGDFMSVEEVRKMAYAYMVKGNIHQIDVGHDNEDYETFLVESFIVRADDPDFIEGAWVAGIHIPDEALWKQVKNGELNGFSMEAHAQRIKQTLDLNIPSVIKGDTSEVEGHCHPFTVRFADDGVFLGGTAHAVPGHEGHRIEHGTFTEKTDKHQHRFVIMDQMFDAQS